MAFSCATNPAEKAPETFADSISLQDSLTARYASILEGYKADRKGSIAIIGEGERAKAQALNMMTFDGFDNGSGKAGKDFLADFAGENFDLVYDVVNDYSPKADSASLFNEMQLKNIILSLDTVCFDSQTNLTDIILKDPAKIVVLASIQSDVASEIEKIKVQKGADIKVFQQGDLLKKYLSNAYEPKSYVAIWGREEVLKSGIYHDLVSSAGLRTYSSAMDFETAKTSKRLDADTLFFAYMDTLAARRPYSKVSCVIVDDVTLASKIPALNARAARLAHSHDSRYEKYSQFLGKDFRFINVMDIVSKELYLYMREANLFTHRVEKPLFTPFVTVGDESDFSIAYYDYGN